MGLIKYDKSYLGGSLAKYQVLQYQAPDGTRPFSKWVGDLDEGVKGRVIARVERFQLGLLGDKRHLGEGLCEARLDFGPGYRLYFGVKGNTLILLLCGGDKSSQGKDIKKARQFWQDFLGGQR